MWLKDSSKEFIITRGDRKAGHKALTLLTHVSCEMAKCKMGTHVRDGALTNVQDLIGGTRTWVKKRLL